MEELCILDATINLNNKHSITPSFIDKVKELELYSKDKSTKGIQSKKKCNGQNIVILYTGIFG